MRKSFALAMSLIVLTASAASGQPGDPFYYTREWQATALKLIEHISDGVKKTVSWRNDACRRISVEQRKPCADAYDIVTARRRIQLAELEMFLKISEIGNFSEHQLLTTETIEKYIKLDSETNAIWDKVLNDWPPASR